MSCIARFHERVIMSMRNTTRFDIIKKAGHIPNKSGDER